MCAIIGNIGKDINKKQFEASRDVLSHRGPNAKGVYYDEKNNVALGHRRLSIIDLSDAGTQPFVSNDKRYVLIFNGEIYNYIELKKGLEADYDFQTKTDTEVLLAAYIKWGKECLNRFNGMFSFAIWDTQERKLFAARDRLGIKPFYYTFEDGALEFSSEIKGLLALGVPNDKDDHTIFEYLYRGYYDHTENTFFKHIKQLRPGHFLTLKNKELIIEKYWDIADVEITWDYSDEQKVVETFRELLSDSIRLRFRSDVPVGVNLSSGIDSNSLLHFARKVTGQVPHMFSMCLPSEEYNECSLINTLLSDEYKQKWHTTTVDPDSIFETGTLMNKIQDEPFGGIPTIAYFNLHKLAKDNNVTVLLEGQGVDELLGGYAYYQNEIEKDEAHISIYETSEGVSQDKTREVYTNVLNSGLIEKHKQTTTQFPKPFTSHLLNAQYRDLLYTKLPRVLRFNDRVSMAFGRELRLPYLDHRLVEFCFNLPRKYKISNGQHKILIRTAMKEIIPHVFKQKEKKAFGAIQTEWLRNKFKYEVYSVLEDRQFKTLPYWDHSVLKEEVDKFYEGKGDNSFFIWQFLNLNIWLKI